MPEYRPLFGSLVLATIGDQLARLALTVLVFQRTGSPVLSALTFAIGYLPWVVGGPVLAALADRLPRHRVMVVSDLARAGLVALMAIPGVPLPALLGLLLLVSVGAPPYEAARAALTADILTGDRYVVATSVAGIVLQLAQVVGFLLGGLLVTAVSPSLGLLLNAATFAVSGLWLLGGLRSRPAPLDPDAPAAQSVWRDTAAGLRLVLGDRRLVAVVTLLWVGVLLNNAHEGIGPALSDELSGGQTLVGVLLAVHPAGAVVGGVVVGRFCPPQLRERLVAPLVVLSVAATAAAGLAARLPDDDLAVPLFVAALAVAGFGSAWTIPLNAAFVQAVPPTARGRALGIAMAGMFAVQGLGALAAGAAADLVPASTVVLLTGLVGLPLVVGPLLGLVRTRPPAGVPVAGPSGP